jgi:glucose/arabinose dehydrogenase
MRLPNGLAAEGNSLYIIGDGAVYRYENDSLTTIADDLPGGRGFMASGIAVQDGLIYLGIPYPCNLCDVDNELYGTVLSMDANGENRQIVARGLRYPAGLAFYQGALYVTDTGRDNLDFSSLVENARNQQDEALLDGIQRGYIPPYDEVNRIDLGGDIPHFGFPYCLGLENIPDVIGDFDCADATAPTWIFRSRSNPLALQAYDSTTFPWLRGTMLIALGGSFDNSIIEGYALVAARNLDDGRVASEVILPTDVWITFNQLYVNEQSFISTASSETVNRRGAGIWPHRIYDIAVSPEGWIYSSVGGEGIYVLRPGNISTEEICRRWRECP